MEEQTRTVPQELRHEITIRGTFNGKQFELKGEGSGQPYDGTMGSRFESTGVPLPFSMHLLDIVALFGLPTYSKYHEDTTELFKSSDGYEYERHLKYENGGYMSTLHRVVWKDGDCLSGDFQVLNGECTNVPELEGIEPIVETFLPAGPGKIKSHCVIVWRKKGGGVFTAECQSEYRLKHSRSLPLPQWRMVEFTTNHTQMVLDQKERLDVFRYLPRPGSMQ